MALGMPRLVGCMARGRFESAETRLPLFCSYACVRTQAASRDVTVYVLQLARDVAVLLDEHYNARALEDMVLVVANAARRCVSNTCIHTLSGPGTPTRRRACAQRGAVVPAAALECGDHSSQPALPGPCLPHFC